MSDDATPCRTLVVKTRGFPIVESQYYCCFKRGVFQVISVPHLEHIGWRSVACSQPAVASARPAAARRVLAVRNLQRPAPSATHLILSPDMSTMSDDVQSRDCIVEKIPTTMAQDFFYTKKWTFFM